MRFLTRSWHAGELSDEQAAAAEDAYLAHRAAVLPSLTPALRRFATTVDVHDALLRQALLDRRNQTLRLDLRCGDQQRGYFDLALTYRGVRLEKLDTAVLAVIARDSGAEALYLEEDVFDNAVFVHRWLWSPFGRELDIVFEDLEYSCEPRRDRLVEPLKNRYAEIGVPDL